MELKNIFFRKLYYFIPRYTEYASEPLDNLDSGVLVYHEEKEEI